jgi:hypothetical protein
VSAAIDDITSSVDASERGKPSAIGRKKQFSLSAGLDNLKQVFTKTLQGISTKYSSKEAEEAKATAKAAKGATLSAIKAEEAAATAATVHAVKVPPLGIPRERVPRVAIQLPGKAPERTK